MRKTHTDTLGYIIRVYNDIFDQIDGVMHALAKKKSQRKEDLVIATQSV
jgi:hypothetical protein